MPNSMPARKTGRGAWRSMIQVATVTMIGVMFDSTVALAMAVKRTP